MTKKTFTLFCLVTAICATIYGQNGNIKDKATRVFLDCEYCDVEHIKKEITFVNYVRDRKDAQVHILFTEEYTGSGGEKHTFYFIGQKEFTGQADTLSFSLPSDATRDETRNKQVNLIRMGLVRYVAKTPYAEKLMISFEEQQETESVTDKWNSWVFSVNANGFFNGQQSYKYFSGYASANAQRVTEDLKVEFYANFNYNESKYIMPDTTYLKTSKNNSFSHILVKSINDHWSYGYSTGFETSLYQNYNLSVSFYPSIEYNLFPYSKSNRKQLRFLYGLGVRYFDYIDTTIYNKTKELLPHHRLGISARFVEKWGSVSASVVGSNYFHNISLKRLQIDSDLSLRLFKGLSLSLYGGVSIIHDPLNLVKGELSTEDMLLQQRQIASDFDYWGSVGLSYSFGSIYNNVVNPRFGN